MPSDPYKYFRVEARDLLEQINQGIMALEREDSSREVVPRLLRLAHTLKGAARVVKQPQIADLAHEIEDVLAPFREGQQSVRRDDLDLVLELGDAIGARVMALAAPAEESSHASPDEPFRTLRTDVAELDGLLDRIAETQTWLGSLRRTAASLAQARRLVSLVEEHVNALRASAGQHPRGGGLVNRAVEDLPALVMTIERGLNGGIEGIERELQQVRSAGEQLRLVPVSTLFSILERAVRDAARALGKRAAFRGVGGEARLDGHVLATLQPALVQIVRNAVAHGIETEAERVAAGKSAEGAVVIEVAQRGARIAFLCKDDGRGVDVGAVQRALQRKGRLQSGARLAPENLLQMLLEGGVSTSSVVTDASGRGIGLDIVRDVRSRLGGQATIQTRAGEGTVLELIVPVSLSSLEALTVEASGIRAAIPMDCVRQIVRVSRKDLASSAASDSILYEGASVPFLALAQVLGRDAHPDKDRAAWSTVVIARNNGMAALGVERLLGRATILVRPLPALAHVAAIIGGVSLDPEGNPQPVLDPEGLIEGARRAERAVPSPLVAVPPILVVDDSLTTRMLEQSILESAGYAVELASSGEEALERARRQRFSLLLVDVEMPGMDGFSLLEHLQSDPELRGVPALLVTSRSAPEDQSRAAELGARGYIVKSEFDQTHLLDSIRGLVG